MHPVILHTATSGSPWRRRNRVYVLEVNIDLILFFICLLSFSVRHSLSFLASFYSILYIISCLLLRCLRLKKKILRTIPRAAPLKQRKSRLSGLCQFEPPVSLAAHRMKM